MSALRKKLTCYMLLVCLFQSGHTQSLQPLTDAEADAIILEQETSKADKKAARIAELEQATVKSEGRGVLPNGQTVIIREVEPPTVGAQLVETANFPAPTDSPTLTPEQLAQFQSFADKDHQSVMLSATVYDRSMTRLSWRYETAEFIAYTNADFNYLRGTSSLETESTRFTFFMGIGDSSYANNPYADEVIPDVSAFSAECSEYVLIKGDPNKKGALAGIKSLLKHYNANLPELKIAQQRRAALTNAQQRYHDAHPEEPEPFIMQFWVPKTSSEASSVE